LYCQWLPLFQLTRAQFEVIGRTFARVFPGAFLVRGDFYADLPIVGLCAFEDGRGMEALDWDLIEQGCRRLRVGDPGREIRDALVRHPDGVAMCLLGPLPAELTGAGPINTLANSRVEWDAGRNIIGLREPWFIGVPWAQLARDIHRVGAGLVPGVRRAAHDAGQFFLTLEIAALSGSPVRANLEAQVGERLPPGVRLDAGARWEGWPARVKILGSAMSGASGGVR
jgi:hypothetical protein